AASAVDEQISASRSAAQTARQAADAYRQITTSLADAVRQLRGGDLSPLLPGQKLAEARTALDAAFGQASTGDAAALAKLPQVATDFLNASRAYNASSQAYTDDFAHVMDLLAKAGATSNAAALKQDYQATLLEIQTGVLEDIKAILAAPSLDAAALNEQTKLLSTIGVLLKDQTGVLLTGNTVQDVIRNINELDSHYSEAMLRSLITGTAAQTDSLTNILTGTDNVVSLLRQLVDATVRKTAQDQAAAQAAEQKAAADRALQQQVAQTTAAYQAQQAVSDAAKAQWLSALSAASVSMSVYTAENIAAGQRQVQLVTYDPAKEAALAATHAARQQYIDAFGQAYSLYQAIPGHADGGVASGWSIVGEQGPELVNFGSPGRVYTADQTNAALGGGITKEDIEALKKAIAQTNAILQALAEATSKDVNDQTVLIATAVEQGAETIGRIVAHAAEANTRA
ncbi:MAG: hypothetical protein IH603_05405, partial [Burkholderia vietnamiensis]|nr:hypothetical protein [Burkholderia vietnamiensis]